MLHSTVYLTSHLIQRLQVHGCIPDTFTEFWKSSLSAAQKLALRFGDLQKFIPQLSKLVSIFINELFPET
jgi:hypothetical protein